MSTAIFNESDHPRAEGGQFATKNHAEADVSLDVARPRLFVSRTACMDDARAAISAGDDPNDFDMEAIVEEAYPFDHEAMRYRARPAEEFWQIAEANDWSLRATRGPGRVGEGLRVDTTAQERAIVQARHIGLARFLGEANPGLRRAYVAEDENGQWRFTGEADCTSQEQEEDIAAGRFSGALGVGQHVIEPGALPAVHGRSYVDVEFTPSLRSTQVRQLREEFARVFDVPDAGQAQAKTVALCRLSALASQVQHLGTAHTMSFDEDGTLTTSDAMYPNAFANLKAENKAQDRADMRTLGIEPGQKIDALRLHGEYLPGEPADDFIDSIRIDETA